MNFEHLRVSGDNTILGEVWLPGGRMEEKIWIILGFPS